MFWLIIDANYSALDQLALSDWANELERLWKASTIT